MAYARLSPNAIGSVITYLETTIPTSPVASAPEGFTIERLVSPKTDRYCELFRKVGQNWLWFERLTQSRRDLRLLIRNSKVAVYVVLDPLGADAGMVELDFRNPRECNLAYIGLVPALTGKGYGQWLLERALSFAWSEAIEKVTVNTCTLDHPAALKTYLRAGFRVKERAIGTFVDPRLRGLLPKDAAPQIPFVEGAEVVTEMPPATAQTQRP